MKKLLFLFICISFTQFVSASVYFQKPDKISGICLKLIDGENLIVKIDQAHRLGDVHTISLAYLFTPAQNQKYYKEAFEFTEKLILGKKVYGKRISDNQYIIRIGTKDGPILNELLLKEGLAFWNEIDYDEFNNDYYFYSIDAQENKLNIWSQKAPVESPWIAQEKLKIEINKIKELIQDGKFETVLELVNLKPKLITYIDNNSNLFLLAESVSLLSKSYYRDEIAVKKDLSKEKAFITELLDVFTRTNKPKFTSLVSLLRGQRYVKDPFLMMAVIKRLKDINEVDSSGFSAIFNASHPECLDLLIKRGADINIKSFGGWTPLHTLSPYLPAVKKLVKAGIDVNAVDRNGFTCFSFDVQEDTLSYLVKNGFNLDIKDKSGKTLLQRVMSRGDILSKITDDEKKHTLAQLKLLVEQGASLKNIDNHGRTIIHSVVDSETEQTIPYLKSLGCDLSIKDKDGETPLDLAKRLKYINMVKALKEHGAK
ncbi:MAG: thermonuclease family protein [Lentisphaeraceae bacterium]|nr:thermonuclease family protein [Lentisphaeraceae bacterium]